VTALADSPLNHSIDCTSERDFRTRDAEGHAFFDKEIIQKKRKAPNRPPVAHRKV
jgi:hypothetical protein